MHDELSELEKKLLACQLEVNRDIKDINRDLHKYGTRVRSLEKAQAVIEESLARAELDRHEAKKEQKSFADYAARELREIKSKFSEKVTEEEEFREELLESISELVSITRDNSDYISKQEAEKEKEEYALAKVAEINKPREDLLHTIKMAAIGVVTTTIVSGMIAGILFMYDLYKLINPSN